MANFLRKSQCQISLFECFVDPKIDITSLFNENAEDGIQIRVFYTINKESVANFSLFIAVKVKKNLRKSQAQFREKLGKLRLRQNDGFPTKKNVY